MKLLIIGDLHHGMKNDSPKHNQQINEFVDHVCKQHKDVDKVIQLGDWFDSRSKIHLSTLNRGIESAERLSATFGKDNVHVITGNHDMSFRDSYKDTSLVSIEHLVDVVYEPLTIDNCYLVPWIVTEEHWNTAVSGGKDHDYLFAHLELNGFYMNDFHMMDGGIQSPKELRDYEKVFTGHYHSYQEQKNVVYTGTPIPMSQNEANKDMGYVILDTTTGEWTFEVYDKVQVVSIPYTQLDDVIDTLDPENTSIRVEFPDTLDDETKIGEVIDRLNELSFSDVKTKYKGNKAQKLMESEVEIEEVENIDKVVVNFIKTSSSVEGIDSGMLESLYSEAKERNND